jgi:hypothetical protein
MADNIEDMISHKLNRLADGQREILATLKAHTDVLASVQADITMLRAAINDFARTNVTAGEIEAIHTDLGRLREQTLRHESRLNALEAEREH